MWFYLISLPLTLSLALAFPRLETTLPLGAFKLPLLGASLFFLTLALLFPLTLRRFSLFRFKTLLARVSLVLGFFFFLLFRFEGQFTGELEERKKQFDAVALSFTNLEKPLLYVRLMKEPEFKQDYFEMETRLLGFQQTKTAPLTPVAEVLFFTLKSRLAPPPTSSFQAGQLLTVSPYFALKTSEGSNSSYKNYLLRNRNYGTGYFYPDSISISSPPAVLVKEAAWSWNGSLAKKSLAVIQQAREKIASKVETYVAAPASGLVWGLLTGERKKLPEEIQDLFRSTGTYHFLAVSGLHAGLLSVLCFSLLRLLGLRKRLALLPVLVLVLPLYLALSLFPISMIRTYFMALVGYGLFLADRKFNLLSLICFTFLFAALVYPPVLATLSFQLSFSAVLGIAFMLEVITQYGVKTWLAKYVLISLGAQFFNAPFVIYTFGYFNFFGLFYNLLLSFLIPLVLLYSLLLLLSPLAALSVAIGKTLTLLNHSLFHLLSLTQYESSWFHFELKGQVPAAVLFFSANLCLVLSLLYYGKKVNPARIKN